LCIFEELAEQKWTGNNTCLLFVDSKRQSKRKSKRQ